MACEEVDMILLDAALILDGPDERELDLVNRAAATIILDGPKKLKQLLRDEPLHVASISTAFVDAKSYFARMYRVHDLAEKAIISAALRQQG
jgi:hypothetical protein